MSLSRRTTLSTRMTFWRRTIFSQTTRSKCNTGIGAVVAGDGGVVVAVGGAEAVACVSGAGSVQQDASGSELAAPWGGVTLERNTAAPQKLLQR
jgi:hypothetical protein